MSALGDLIGDIGAAAGDTGKNTVERLTKNRDIQTQLDASLKDYTKTKTASSLALDQYIKDYLSGGAAAKTRTAQETGAIDRYYNGDVERQLAELRTRRAQAGDEALRRSLGYMTRTMNSDRLTGSSGGGSYDRQLALRMGGDLNLQTMLDNLNQERADQEYLRQSQLGLAGRRTGMADALALRDLVPANAMKSELGWNLGTLGDITKLDQMNNFYGVKYNPSASEMAGNITGDVASLAMSMYGMGMFGGAGGMLGGGGSGSSQTTGTGTNWSMPVAANNWSGTGAPTNTNWGMGGTYNYEEDPYGWGAGSMTRPQSSFSLPPLGSMYSSMGGWGGGF